MTGCVYQDVCKEEESCFPCKLNTNVLIHTDITIGKCSYNNGFILNEDNISANTKANLLFMLTKKLKIQLSEIDWKNPYIQCIFRSSLESRK